MVGPSYAFNTTIIESIKMMFEFFDPESSILEGINSHEANLNFQLTEHIQFDDRWLAVSNLQKAVRRGLYNEAMRSALILQHIDEDYMWRRLKIIALEDIGVADLNATGQVLWGAGKRQWQDQHGTGLRFLSYFISILCKAKKCRSLDDAIYVALFHTLYQSQRQQYAELTEREIFDKFSDPSLDIAERVILAWYLCGTKSYRASTLEHRNGNPRLLVDLAHFLGLPPFVADTLQMAKSNEFYVSLIPCWIQLEQSAKTKIVTEVEPPCLIFGSWLPASLDKHTRQGKIAFRSFIDNCPELHQSLRNYYPNADHVSLVGYLVFGIEGRMLDRRLDFDGATCLLELAIEAWVQSIGSSSVYVAELLKIVERNVAILHEQRRNILIKQNKIAPRCT